MQTSKNIFTAALVLGTLAACNTTNTGSNTTNDTTMTNSGSVGNDSSRQGSGYVALFDGKTLEGWRTYRNKGDSAWSVQDGVLHCAGSESDKSDMQADLITNDQYANFDFSVEWKIAPQGNSGIMYLVGETEEAAYMTGPEYQLIDDANFPEKLEDWQKTGANYAMHPAPDARPNPVGQWNQTRIVVNGGKVEHWLNGTRIVAYDMSSDEWKSAKNGGKWKDTPAYGTVKKGHIALQNHGSEAWFRDIKIKQL